MKTKKYCVYKGNEYGFAKNMEGEYLLVTHDQKLIDDTFIDRYQTGVFTKVIELNELEELYTISTYGVVNNQKVDILKENESDYVIGTNDCKVAEELKLERTDKYGYEGVVAKENVEVIIEKSEMKI